MRARAATALALAALGACGAAAQGPADAQGTPAAQGPPAAQGTVATEGPSAPRGPGPSGFTRDEIAAFVAALQAAVATDRPRQVAPLVSFPLRVNTGPDRSRSLSRRQFVSDYARVVTPTVRLAVTGQDRADIHEDGQGVMFGRGQLWASGVCEDRACRRKVLRVTAINLNAQ